MANVFDRQVCRVGDAVAIDVGDRYFGGRCQIGGVIGVQPKQVFFKLWQLTCAKQSFIVNDVRHVRFCIPVLLGLHIEHQLRQRAMQASKRSFENHKSRSGQFDSRFKIERVELFSNLNVIERLVIK